MSRTLFWLCGIGVVAFAFLQTTAQAEKIVEHDRLIHNIIVVSDDVDYGLETITEAEPQFIGENEIVTVAKETPFGAVTKVSVIKEGQNTLLVSVKSKQRGLLCVVNWRSDCPTNTQGSITNLVQSDEKTLEWLRKMTATICRSHHIDGLAASTTLKENRLTAAQDDKRKLHFAVDLNIKTPVLVGQR